MNKLKLLLAIISTLFIASLFTGCGASLNTETIIRPKEIIAVKPAIKDSLLADTTHSKPDSVEVFTKTRENDNGKIDTQYVAKYYPITRTLTVTAPPESIKVMVMDTLRISTPAKDLTTSIWEKLGLAFTSFMLGAAVMAAALWEHFKK